MGVVFSTLGISLPAAQPLKTGLSPDKAVKMTALNGLDEVYLQDPNGQQWVVYGRGLPMDRLRVGFSGRMGNVPVTVTALDNEINSAREGIEKLFGLYGRKGRTALDPAAAALGQSVVAGATMSGMGIVGWMLKRPVPVLAPAIGTFTGAVSGGMVPAAAGFLIGVTALIGVSAVGAALWGRYRKSDPATLSMVLRDSAPVSKPS